MKLPKAFPDELHIRYSTRYRLLQTVFWMMFCVEMGYITYYLTQFSYTTGQIGALTASFGLIAAFTQTWAGRIADRGRLLNWRNLILILSLCCLTDMIILHRTTKPLTVGLLYGLFIVLCFSMLPLVNAGCFYLNQAIRQGAIREAPIDFGIARGLGSLSYAVLSFLLGRLTAACGYRPVTIAGICVSAMLFIVTLSIRYEGMSTPQNTDDTEHADTDASVRSSFFKRYPVVLLMMTGLVFILIFHNLANIYLLQIVERIGGSSAQMGTAFAIAGISEIPTLFFFARIRKRFSSGFLLFVCGVVYFLRVLLMLVAGHIWILYASQILQFASFALYASAAVYYVEEMVEPHDRSKGQALVGGVSVLGQVIGSLLGGLVLQLFGVAVLLWMSCLLVLCGTLIVRIAYRRSDV